MHIGKLKIVLLVLCCLALGFEIWRSQVGVGPDRQFTSPIQRHKPDFVLLPENQVTVYAALFGDPKSRVESWEPTLGDIDDLNSDLSQVSAISSKEPDPNRHIDAPDTYFRQYLAAVVNGKRTIFVNALCSGAQPPNLRKQLIFGADGGKCFWHADYDPATRTFSNLKVNGSL